MTAPGLQFLESLDSVRAAPAPGDDALDQALELQVFLEVLLTLALGRAVVVPQSYAFDSLSFLTVADRVLRARAGVRPGRVRDRPFRLHLHGQPSYEAAVASMLSRVHDPTRPFVSSLLPELVEVPQPRVRRLAETPAELWRWAEDRRPGLGLGTLLQTVHEEFVVQAGVSTVPASPAVTLHGMLLDLVDDESPLRAGVRRLPSDERERIGRLVEAVQVLAPGDPGAFAERFSQRSRLRQPAPWPGDRDERSAEQLIGADLLPLVVEFVDTSYNRAVAGSIGTAAAAYSTSATSIIAEGTGRELAQRVALSRGGQPGATAAGAVGQRTFELQLDAGALSGRSGRPLANLSQQGEDALLAVLEARAGDTGSPFWVSACRLHTALEQGRPDVAQRALDRHLRLLADLLTGTATVSPINGGIGMTMASASGSTAGPVVAQVLQLGLAEAAVVSGAGGLLPVLAGVGLRVGARRRRRARTVAALGHVVTAVPTGGTA